MSFRPKPSINLFQGGETELRIGGKQVGTLPIAAGGGEMGERIRTHAWATSAIGGPETWPHALRMLIDLMLSSSQPMFVVWGPERTTLYNDGYRDILADRHPALGQPFERIWPEIWERDLSPIVARAYAGEALHMDDIALIMTRKGYPEETHFSFSYTPVRGPDGAVEGFFCPCLEITDQVLEERRALLRAELTERLRDSSDPDAVIRDGLALLGRHLSAEQVAYAEIDQAGEHALISQEWNDGRMPSNAGRHRLQDFGPDFIADLKAGRSVAIGNVGSDPRTSMPDAAATFAARGIRAFLSVPHFREDLLVAVLAVHASGPRHWHPADVALAEEVAERLNLAIERARSEAARRESEARLRDARDSLALATRASGLGWCAWDLRTGQVTADDLARQIMDLDAADVSGLVWLERTHPDDRESLRHELDAHIHEDRPFDLEYRIIHRDGTERHIHGTGIIRRDAQGMPVLGTGFVRDVTERKRAEKYQQMLTAELDHRVKNILAVVQAIAGQTLRSGKGAGSDAAGEFIGRIQALARSHMLLASSHWAGASLRDLVDGAVAPYQGAGTGRILVEGPDLTVVPKAAQTFTLALHELVTNAAKHGALSHEEGRVTATWRRSGEGRDGSLILLWHEIGGPHIETPPTRTGFGTRLIQQTLAHELDGEVSLDYAFDGLRACIDVPLARLLPASAERISEPHRRPPSPGGDRTILEGKKVLVVEDEYFIGQDAVAVLTAAGCSVTGPVASLAEALRIAVEDHFDCAVLDINLSGSLVWPAARALVARRIPCLFATSYSHTIERPPELGAVPLIEKPMLGDSLLSAMSAILSARADG
ncbi:HWE histidine kinase domain-containing protein [Rhodobacter sp. NSM]|uniref:HWE histidine kinase domain-containing protein n=1 Tax=Rhodobacter sp. NSM TaxID=3457501 RepID=UPI003FCFEF84